MKKKYLALFLAAGCFAGKSQAQQHCGTDEMGKIYKQSHPEISIYEKQLSDDIAKFIARSGKTNVAAKTTAAVHNDTDYYDIPVVIHVMHSYGNDIIADNEIYKLIANMNAFYNAQNDLSSVIAPFRQYIGKAKIRFHLASIDPAGHPTKGITHRYNYLTFGGDDQVKMDLWAPEHYYNIWFENFIGLGVAGGTVLAYATPPTSAASNPFSDGVISGYQYINDDTYTIQHETGHYFNLAHPWNSSGLGSGEACGDDEVDDTPPTKGHFSTCNLYDTACANNYFKLYTNAAGLDSLANYPDTTNTQNVMDYSSCTNMFTKGQVWRMRGALNSTIANRINLWDSTNLSMTGADVPAPDLLPNPDFCVKSANVVIGFTFPSTNVAFASKSWGDTITQVAWTFSNGAQQPTATQTGTAVTANLNNQFTEPGWVNVKMDVTGNNTGVATATYPHALFVADAVPTNVDGYLEEFAAGGDRDKWPIFNYFNNEFKWKLNDDVGFYDHSSMMYEGFDSRLNPALLQFPVTGTPKGDFDDFFTVPVDLSAFTDACNLNYFYSSKSRSSNTNDINDTLLIDYSVNKSMTWTRLATIGKSGLINQGASATYYTPTSQSEWSPKTIALPTAARSAYTTFRFRYKPGVNTTSLFSTGNNFYMDRLGFSRLPAEASNLSVSNTNIAVVPNPTQGDAFVIVKDASNTAVQIIVTDITGKVVYTVSQEVKGNEARITIPHTAISAQGMYLVQTRTGSQVSTQKLVVY